MRYAALLLAALGAGCGGDPSAADASGLDAFVRDGGTSDGGTSDGGTSDGGTSDGGAASSDGGFDAGPECELTRETSTETASGLAVTHHDGQSFVTWRDRAEGEAGADYRYRLYRSPAPIVDDAALAGAELVADGILNHSGQLFGSAFTPPPRVDPTRPTAIVEEGGDPLPLWSGLWVATARTNGCAYFAVLATDVDGEPVEHIEPGVNATIDPVAERFSPIAPMKIFDSNERPGPYVPQTRISGERGLPLQVLLHASNATGGGAGDYGDYYLYFGDETMGYQDGRPGVFSVEERRGDRGNLLMMRNRDTIVSPDGSRGIETHWFGYVAELRSGSGRHAYPYTEERLSFMIPFVVTEYGADPNRVYLAGGSMGAWGTALFGLRRPEVFAAVYPDRPRFRQRSMASVAGAVGEDDRLPSGERWREHHDSIRFVSSHPGDLPFIGWNCGRNDGFATWQEQVDMVAAMTAGHHGFAFAWNNGDHSGGVAASREIGRWYPRLMFARNESYPAFANSSIDDDLGAGDPADGDLEGGINLGFEWTVTEDGPERWTVELSNALATAPMTVDVTPRRLQAFRPAPEETLTYRVTRDGSIIESGSVSVDRHGLVTVTGVDLVPDRPTTLTFVRPRP